MAGRVGQQPWLGVTRGGPVEEEEKEQLREHWNWSERAGGQWRRSEGQEPWGGLLQQFQDSPWEEQGPLLPALESTPKSCFILTWREVLPLILYCILDG